MYTLRSITKTGEEVNQFLGNRYVLITKKTAPSQVELEKYNHKEIWDITVDNCEKNCYGFIFPEQGSSIALYSHWENFIMTESGKTFSKIIDK